MLPAGHHIWKLSGGGNESLGLRCAEDGLVLAATPLVERRPRGYIVRPQADLARLLERAYGAEITPARLMPGLGVVAAALAENNLCLAQIAAIQLRLPDLPDLPARRDMEAEDRLLKSERHDGLLAGVGWDPAEHPRAGVPPNRAWFAPVGAGGAATPTRLAQNEENERALEEMLDPLAPVRQAQWEARIATLRQIDRGNPNLTYLSVPGAAPTQDALDRLNLEIRSAATRRVMNKVMPGGVPIGSQGNSPLIREAPGGRGRRQTAVRLPKRGWNRA